MIYVILPKQHEGPAWGITNDEILVVKATAGEKRYVKAQFKKYLEGDENRPLPTRRRHRLLLR